MRKLLFPVWILVLAAGLVACKTTPTPTFLPTATPTVGVTPTIAATRTPTPPATSTRAPTSTPTATPLASCPGAPPLTLQPGDWAIVSLDPPLPNKVRNKPGSGSELIGQIQPGENVQVLEGPACADGYAWWHVRSLAGLEGWTVEGDAAGYWLVDPISAWYPLPAPLQSQGTKNYSFREINISVDIAFASGITGSDYFPVATPLPSPQNDKTPLPNDPRGNVDEFQAPNHAAHSSYEISGVLGGYLNVYDLQDPLSRYYLNNLSYDDCTQALKRNLESAKFTPAYLDPFCGIGVGIPLHFIAGVKVIQFTGGKGVRFLLASGNYLTANKLYYNFEGISDDGRYFIRGHFAGVAHPYIVDPTTLLNDFGPLLAWKDGQYDAASASYSRFNKRIEQMLNAGALPLYPNLYFLDTMLESIVMK